VLIKVVMVAVGCSSVAVDCADGDGDSIEFRARTICSKKRDDDGMS
jgi:hypothetical protein